jgi:hypothetical protein
MLRFEQLYDVCVNSALLSKVRFQMGLQLPCTLVKEWFLYRICLVGAQLTMADQGDQVNRPPPTI